MPTSQHVAYLAAMLLFALSACSAEPTGSVAFTASVHQDLSASDITRVKVTVSASDMSSLTSELTKSSGSWTGVINNIPAGSNRVFLAEAFDAAGTKRFQGQTSGVTITAGLTTAVAITLQEIAPPPPYGNEAPIIDSVTASTTSVSTGGALSLTATAHDPNATDTLTYAWTASSGTFSAPAATTTSWTAPSSSGAQTITFTVTDSQGIAVSVSLSVTVVSGTTSGAATPSISFNLWPVVSKVSASRSRLAAGQSTSVSATASDADGNSLSYQWTASCAGSWTNATSSAASFAPSSAPASPCNNCRLTVTVQDGRGGQTTGSLNLCIATASAEQVWKLNEAWYTVSPNVACGGCANNNSAVGSCTPGQTVYTSVGIRNCYYFANNTYPGSWYTAGDFWSPECDTTIGPVYCHAPVRSPCGGDRGESNRACP